MKILIVYLLFLIANLAHADNNEHTIYQYSSKSGVTEFSDTLDSNKKLVKKIIIRQPSDIQVKEGLQRLNKVRDYNKDFTKRYYDEKKREYDAKKRKEKEAKEIAKRKQEAHDETVSKMKHNHKRRKHLRRDRMREKNGKPAHP